MKQLFFVLVFCLYGMVCSGAAEQDFVAADQALRDELVQRMETDQAVRRTVMEQGDSPDSDVLEKMVAIDRDNTAWLKRIIAEKGWPTISLVGDDGASAAWLLVQHADADPDFQAQVLSLMEASVAKQEASPGNFALLTDRVLSAQGKPQRYGTQ
ncbi:MAG: hypothetical protein LBE21_03350, partial [Pseudomonadales bacterium]|nr:hypothetical protein [Pseudomonadales bacterium]